jgi:phage-related protein (TIGR01555 family)
MGAVIDIARRFGDGLTNLVSRMGTDRDKATHSVYGPVILTDEQLFNAYRGSWLPKKIIDIPALDSCRKWRDWQADAGQIEKIEAEEKRLNVRGKVLEARTKARLWGGAAILIGTGDADPSQPLDPEKVKVGGVKYLTVVTRRELTADEIDREADSEFYGKPASYTLNSQNGQPAKIHPSRLVIFHGAPVPDEDLNVNKGWSDSVLTAVLEAVRNADSTAANVASLVFEAKVDVIRAPNFMASLSDPEYESRWLNRFTLANMGKGVNGTLILDKEEEYDSKSANFSNLPDVIDRFLQIVAGAADIPLTRLLGTSPGGLNSTGESDLRNYYDRISAGQQIEMTPAMFRMDEAIIRSALGDRPPEVHYIWSSLWQISDKERADIGKINAETIKTLNDTGLFPPEALANAGANMLVENSIMPGLEQEIDDAGGLPDYEMEAEQEREAEQARLEAAKGQVPGKAGQLADAAPRTLYIRRDVLNVDDIRKWARSQGFDTVQDGLHVTIIHTRTPLDWIKVGSGDEWAGNDGKIEIAPGGPRLMERFGDAVVLQFASSRLTWRHEDIKRMGAQTDYPDYQPHITISWGAADIDLRAIEPYKGTIELGPEIFEEVNENWRATVTEE